MEKEQAHAALIKILAGAAVVVAVVLIFLFFFTLNLRRAQYETCARQLYYASLTYTALHPVGPYDETDGTCSYLTDASRLSGLFSAGGRIRVIVGPDGAVQSAEWEKDTPRDFIDQFLPFPAVYP